MRSLLAAATGTGRTTHLCERITFEIQPQADVCVGNLGGGEYRTVCELVEGPRDPGFQAFPRGGV
jgi:hypothetical protein